MLHRTRASPFTWLRAWGRRCSAKTGRWQAPASFGETLVGLLRAALDFGGGLDFRLTRLVSLRAEARDFVTGRGLGGVEGRNHPIFSFGLGIHW